MVLCDPREEVNTATWLRHIRWEPLTTTIVGYWSISHSPPSLHQQPCGSRPTLQESCKVLHYRIFYLSTFTSVKNGTIHCCCSSCLVKWFSKWWKQRTGLLFLRQITLPEVKVPSISLLIPLFFISSSSLQGPFQGQKRIFRAPSRGLLVAANDDLGIEAYSTAVLLGSQAAKQCKLSANNSKCKMYTNMSFIRYDGSNCDANHKEK